MRNFKDNEFSNISMIKKSLLIKLDNYRDYLCFSVVITSDYSKSGHADNSEHYTGEAVDCKSKCPLWWQIMCADRAGFENIGVYPAWNGLHLGIRGNEKRRWIGMGNDSTQKYIDFNMSNLSATLKI